MRKFLTGIGLCVLLFLFIRAVTYTPSRPASDQGNTDALSTPAFVVSATQLWSAYQANEVAADNAYKGKRLVVQGRVVSITKDAFDEVHVRFGTRNEFESVDAILKRDYRSAAAGLQNGQTLSVECEGDGMIVDTPFLKNCSF